VNTRQFETDHCAILESYIPEGATTDNHFMLLSCYSQYDLEKFRACTVLDEYTSLPPRASAIMSV